MAAKVTEVADGLLRISVLHEGYGMQFVHYLLRDDEPFLMHTGMRAHFPAVLQGVRTVMDPARLRWIGFSHYEADECGALTQWCDAAAHAQPVCGVAGVMLNLADQSPREARALLDGETLQTGRHALRYLATPHLPHGMDAGMFFDETDATLFCSDLFFQPGDPPPVTEADIMDTVRAVIAESAHGPLAADMPWTPASAAQLARLESLAPRVLAVMHGSTYRGDGAAALRTLTAILRERATP
jgi:flavorubredoxin